MNHHCRICGGNLKPQQVTRLQQYEGRWFMIEHLDALVCEQCGETYFTPEAHDRVVDLITSKLQPVRMEAVPVFDASRKVG